MEKEVLGKIEVYCPYCGWRHEIKINEEYFEENTYCSGCGENFTLIYNTDSAIVKIIGDVEMEEN